MPEYNYRLIRKLANTSLRLNVVLVCAIALNLLMVAACYWSLSRLVEQQRSNVDLHFKRLIGSLHQHEDFLTRIARHGNESAQRQDMGAVTAQHRLVIDEAGAQLHEGSQYSFSMPFTVAQRHGQSGLHPGNFVLGVMLADFYSHYWSTSFYVAPQVFIIGAQGNTSLAVPAIGHFPGQGALTQRSYLAVVDMIYSTVHDALSAPAGAMVRWQRARPLDPGQPAELIGYLGFQLPDALWWAPDAKRQVLAVTLLNLDRIYDPEQLIDRPVYDHLQLMSPQGDSLIESVGAPDDLRPDLNLTTHGLVFKVGGATAGGWTALYQMGYQSFFGYAKWQLLGAVLVLLATLMASWAAMRWYSRRVILPARQAHQEIVESDTFSRAVLQTAPVALCVLRRADGRLLMHNPLVELLLGDAQRVEQMSAAWGLAADQGPPLTELNFENPDGNTLHASFALARYQGEEVVLCAFNDISAHKSAERILAAAKRDADAASAAKSRFLATMSHEIRTPLYGALGTLELLALTPLSRQQRNYLETIEQSSALLLQLVSDVLDASKIEAGEMTLSGSAFDPVALTQTIAAGYAGVAERKGLRLDVCIDVQTASRVEGDALRIRQVLGNLLGNALKFTEQGVVTVSLGTESVGSRLVLNWQVADTGPGIAADQQQRLFEPFYQAHRNDHRVNGTGLGLSICARLAELMQARLQVASEPGAGSCFSFCVSLPVSPPQLSEPTALPAPGQASVPVALPAQPLMPGQLALRVLVVEDNPINQALLEEQLQTLGCHVTLASNGHEALQGWCGDVDAVLTDLNMPVMGGLEWVRALRGQGATVPIVGITASAAFELADPAAGAGLDAWLVKPVNLAQLHEVLQRLCPAGALPPRSDGAQDVLDEIDVSPRMRALFIKTLRVDIQRLRGALQDGDKAAVEGQLHRLRGALEVVQARHLAQACERLERLMPGEHIERGFANELAGLLNTLEGLLERLIGRDSALDIDIDDLTS